MYTVERNRRLWLVTCCESFATEQATEGSGDAEVMNSHMQVPLHLRVEDHRAAAAAVDLALVAVLHRKVHLDVHLQSQAANHMEYLRFSSTR